MSDIDIWIRFPEMRPIRQAPSLGTVNGIGTKMLGERDADDETETAVRTRWFTFLGVPLFALGAYRVANAPLGGFYFYGQVRLSLLAMLWNTVCALLFLSAVLTGGWLWHINTEDYRAGQQLAEADRLQEEGQPAEAARRYRQLMDSPTGHAATANDRLKALLQSPPDDLKEAAGVFEVALGLHRAHRAVVPDLYDLAAEHANKYAERDPAGSLALLEVVSPLADKPEDDLARRRKLLERLVKQQPSEAEWASRLAEILDRQGETARCETLLLPHEARLGQQDGAAILGRILAAQGKLERAHRLLDPYVEARLPRLRDADAAYQNALRASRQRLVELINARQAPDFPFDAFDKADNAGKQALFDEYWVQQLRQDPTVLSAGRERFKQALVGQAALELGIVRLHRAQELADPAARRAELEKAEQTFLAVGSLLEGLNRYKLNLGKVYYWLGKQAEGKKLFDELVQANAADTDTILEVSSALREVGATTEARALAEKAYEKEPDAAKKQSAALMRSLMALDMDDKITWLGRANPENLEVRASLSHMRGIRAGMDGKTREAEQHHREALKTYEKMPDGASVLNNSALVHRALFELTQDPEELRKAADKLERAVALQPGDSILLYNTASAALLVAYRDVIGNAVDGKALRSSPDASLLPYLYNDRAGRDRLVDQLRKHPAFAKARTYGEKLVVLAPKRPESYGFLYGLLGVTQDVKGLEAVLARLQSTEIDLGRHRREMQEYLTGKKDEKRIEDHKKATARTEEVLERARKVGGVTRAVAATRLANMRIRSALLGIEANANEVVQLAEEADRAAPSAATRRSLVEALLFRAHQALVKADKTYAAQAQKTRRSLSSNLLTWVLASEGPLRQAALAQADVKKAAEVRRDQLRIFPEDQGVWTWAFLRGTDPEAARDLEKRLQGDKEWRLHLAMDRLLTPLSATTALEAYFDQLLQGKQAEADKLLTQFSQQGVPLPSR